MTQLPNDSHGVAHFVDEEEPFVDESWSTATDARPGSTKDDEASAN